MYFVRNSSLKCNEVHYFKLELLNFVAAEHHDIMRGCTFEG